MENWAILVILTVSLSHIVFSDETENICVCKGHFHHRSFVELESSPWFAKP
jgi:hypothetical protein